MLKLSNVEFSKSQILCIKVRFSPKQLWDTFHGNGNSESTKEWFFNTKIFKSTSVLYPKNMMDGQTRQFLYITTFKMIVKKRRKKKVQCI